jgi:hypothetical protein
LNVSPVIEDHDVCWAEFESDDGTVLLCPLVETVYTTLVADYQSRRELTDSVNAFDGGIKFRFPINGSGFGPGGKFFGRKLAQVYGASATTNDVTMATSNETSKIQESLPSGRPMITIGGPLWDEEVPRAPRKKVQFICHGSLILGV